MLSRLYHASVWAPEAMAIDDYKYRNLKRVFLPIVDVLYLFGGLSAIRYGVPAINEFFSDAVVDFFGILLAVSAIVAFVGLAIPKFWPLEAAGKVGMTTLMSAYATALLILTRAGEDSRGFVFIIAILAVMIPIYRLSFLGGERRERKAPRP